MIRSKGKFKKWVEAGLLTQQQFEAIIEYEKNKSSGNFGRGLVGLGLFAILIGVLSMIAANWLYIPGNVKLGVHFALNLLMAYGVVHFNANKQWRYQDICLMLFFGLNLTMIALIGQVFQIEGNLANALTLWMIISSPVIFYYAKSHITSVVWSIALMVTLAVLAGEYLFDKHNFAFIAYTFALSLYLPLAFMAAGHHKGFQAWRANFAAVFQWLGAALLIISACIYIQLWYADWAEWFTRAVRDSDMSYTAGYTQMLLIFLSAFAAIMAYAGLCKSLDKPHGKENLLFIVVSCLFIGLPMLLPTEGNSIMPMVAFLGYWGFIGWYGHQTSSQGLVSLATYVLAFRIFIIYAEAMGGLMMTGFGLISGGVTMIAMVWAARKINKRVTEDMKGA